MHPLLPLQVFFTCVLLIGPYILWVVTDTGMPVSIAAVLAVNAVSFTTCGSTRLTWVRATGNSLCSFS